MAHRPKHTESAGKGEARGSPASAESATPMERFKSLARKIVNVPRDAFEEEKQKHKSTRTVPKRPRLL
jgi:hypothetical protein